MNRVQVVLPGFSVRFFFQAKLNVDMVVCMSWLYSCVCVCRCDGDVIRVNHDLNRCSGRSYACSVNVK